MIVELTKEEFKVVRTFIGNLNNRTATKEFNNLFSDDDKYVPRIRAFVNPNSKNIIVDVPEEFSVKLFKVLAANGGTIGGIINDGVGITSAPRIFGFAKNIAAEISACFKRR